jgi:hypothetical protein
MNKVTDTGHLARLQRMLSGQTDTAVGEALREGAEAIAEEAKFSIKDGAISGPGHIPSAPGEPPNADTHDLDESIHVGEVTQDGGSIKTAVIADSEHALPMELGTSTIAERPFMRPATEMHRQDIVKGVQAAVRKVIRGDV